MIVADASAILAILLDEADRDYFMERLTNAVLVLMSPVNAWEVLARAHGSDGQMGVARAEAVIASFNVEIVPIDAELARRAVDAFVRFGKRAPAKLNMGDCFAYALARSRSAPLLFKGDDFRKTDVAVA